MLQNCNTEEYKNNHKYCPQCGCVYGSTTLMSFSGEKDLNRWRCFNDGCKWVGTVHDKIDKKIKECNCKFCIKELTNEN